MKFYLKYIAVVLLAILFTGCAGDLLQDTKKEQLEVKKCFEGYTKAIADKNGDEAFTYLSIKSKKEYDRYLVMCNEFDSTRLQKQGGGILYLVLMTRHLSDPDTLMNITGKQYYISSITNNVANTNSLSSMKPKEVKISGDNADVSVTLPDGSVMENALYFKKENKQWKFELYRTLDFLSDAIRQMAKQSKKTENEIVMGLIEQNTGQQITSAAWIPARKAAVGKYK